MCNCYDLVLLSPREQKVYLEHRNNAFGSRFPSKCVRLTVTVLNLSPIIDDNSFACEEEYKENIILGHGREITKGRDLPDPTPEILRLFLVQSSRRKRYRRKNIPKITDIMRSTHMQNHRENILATLYWCKMTYAFFFFYTRELNQELHCMKLTKLSLTPYFRTVSGKV